MRLNSTRICHGFTPLQVLLSHFLGNAVTTDEIAPIVMGGAVATLCAAPAAYLREAPDSQRRAKGDGTRFVPRCGGGREGQPHRHRPHRNDAAPSG